MEVLYRERAGPMRGAYALTPSSKKEESIFFYHPQQEIKIMDNMGDIHQKSSARNRDITIEME